MRGCSQAKLRESWSSGMVRVSANESARAVTRQPRRLDSDASELCQQDSFLRSTGSRGTSMEVTAEVSDPTGSQLTDDEPDLDHPNGRGGRPPTTELVCEI